MKTTLQVAVLACALWTGGMLAEEAPGPEAPSGGAILRSQGTTEGGLAREAGSSRLPKAKMEGESLAAQVGHYWLYRWYDLIDIVDFSLGGGPGFLINLRVTKAAQLVGGYSDSIRVGFRGRSAGIWKEKRVEGGISILYWQKLQREKICGWIENQRTDVMDFDTVDYYGARDKDRSWTGVGGTVHIGGVVVDINARPMQALDFVLGWFTIDVLEDDNNRAVRNKDL